MTESEVVWRGTTAAERMAPRRRKLLDAGFALLGDHGREGTTVRGVCTKAALNPRYFYESFSDLDALCGAVFDDVVAEAQRRSRAAVDAAPPHALDKTRAALDASIRFIAEDPRRVRIVLRDSAGVLAQRRAEGVRKAAALMARDAAAFYGLPADDVVLRSSTIMLTGGLVELMLAWDQGDLPLTVDELIDHATRLVVGVSLGAGRMLRDGR